MAALTALDWEAHEVYLYRVWPRIDSQTETHYLAKIGRPFDEDELLNTYGSGKYLAILKHKPTKAMKARQVIAVYNDALPPNVDPGHVLKTPENDRYWNSRWSKPKPEPAPDERSAAVTIARMALENSQQGSNSPVDGTLVKLFEEATKQRDELAQKLASTNAAPAASPSDPMKLFRELLTTMRELQPATSPPPPPRTALEQISEVRELFKAVKEISPAPASPEPEGESSIVKYGIGVLGEVLKTVAPFIAQNLLRPPGPPASTPMGHTAVSPQGAATPAATPATHGPTVASDDELARFLMLGLTAFQRGISGADFAFSVATMEGEAALQRLQSVGVEGVMARLAAFPEIKPFTSVIQEFVADFIHFDLNASEEEPDEESTTVQRQ